MILLVIGIDGMSIEDTQELQQRYGGSWGETVTPGYTFPSCASFLTGQPVENHGVTVCGFENKQDSKLTKSAIESHGTYLPKALEPLRTGLCGVPLTYPPTPMNGWTVTGPLTPVAAVACWPTEHNKLILFPGMPNNKLEGIIDGDRIIARNANILYQEDPVDVLCVYFSGWNRAFGVLDWMGPVKENMLACIEDIVALAPDCPRVFWSDHGNKIFNPEPKTWKPHPELQIATEFHHQVKGMVGTTITGAALPGTPEAINHLVVSHVKAGDRAVWDRVTQRHRKGIP